MQLLYYKALFLQKLTIYNASVYSSLFSCSESHLADYEYVQHCIKLDQDLRFVLVDVPKLKRPFLRTVSPCHKYLVMPSETKSSLCPITVANMTVAASVT